MNKPVIVHISNDYPDPVQPHKTRAVLELVKGTADEFTHIVYSLNRKNGFSGLKAEEFAPNRIVITYKALPKGLFWGIRLKNIAKWIENDLKSKNISPDLFEGHKFTVEGVIAYHLAKNFHKPFAVDIQGDTDTNILKKKLSLRPLYKKIAAEAAAIFPYSLWALPIFEKLCGLERSHCTPLPVVPAFNEMKPCEIHGHYKFITVFNADSWKRKNVENVVAAIKTLLPHYPSLSLDIYCRGSDAAMNAMTTAIAAHNISHAIHIKGAARNNELPELMGQYTAFLLPSLRESFGLVYTESLFSGLPILFTKDMGIDGYISEEDAGYACSPTSVEDIARGITRLITDESRLKNQIAELQKSGGLNHLTKPVILKNYATTLKKVLAAKQP